jgi:hypothetical protein
MEGHFADLALFINLNYPTGCGCSDVFLWHSAADFHVASPEWRIPQA